VVALGSPGGSVSEALAAGAEIRRRGLETTLWGNCYSACPLVFLAGTKRTIWSPYPELGFHKIALNGKPIPNEDLTYDVVMAYASKMGANAAVVFHFMTSAEPSEIFSPTMDELCGAKIAMWVQRKCSAE
jgi:hypothetical protein